MSEPPVPVDFELNLVANPDVPLELQMIGRQYWQYEGLHSTLDTIQWTYKVNRIDLQGWGGAAHHVAAASVTASSPTFSCATCGQVLTLATRTALASAREGEDVECRDCDPRTNEQAKRVLDPERRIQREQRLKQKLEAALRSEKEREFERVRRAAIESQYPSDIGEDGEGWVAQASLTSRVGALATIHVASKSDGLIHPFRDEFRPIAPTPEWSYDLLRDAYRAQLLIVHPSSSPDAFVWDEDDSTKLSEQVYPSLALFMTPGEGTLVRRRQEFAQQLRESLRIESMPARDRRQLLEFSRQLVAEEAVRYFQDWFGRHNFPHPVENHLESLRSYAYKGAEGLSLGRLYAIIWSAGRFAADAYTRHDRMPRQNATTHGVNQFIRAVERALGDSNYYSDPYNEVKSLPLSEVTNIVFRLMLNLPPMHATPLEITEKLAVESDDELRRFCDEQLPERSTLMEWLWENTAWTPSQFRDALATVAMGDFEWCAPDCNHERGPEVAYRAELFYDHVVSGVGERPAALITAEATDIGNRTSQRGRAGDFVLAELIRQLGGTPPNLQTNDG